MGFNLPRTYDVEIDEDEADMIHFALSQRKTYYERLVELLDILKYKEPTKSEEDELWEHFSIYYDSRDSFRGDMLRNKDEIYKDYYNCYIGHIATISSLMCKFDPDLLGYEV